MELDLVSGVNLSLREALGRDNLGGLLGAAGAAASDHDRRRGVAVAHRAVRRRGTGAVAVAPAPARARARARPAARWFTHGAVVWWVVAWWYDGAMVRWRARWEWQKTPPAGTCDRSANERPPVTKLLGVPAVP